MCLIELANFASFLTDEHGNIKTRILEPNVRDYQGARNPVNGEIRQTLNDNAPKEEFWWLNNGVTILASACAISGNKIKITMPEIVNGLQTSHEIFAAFSKGTPKQDSRNVLVRVILPREERSRNRVIKATNSQTPVDTVSLRATDRIHFDIEDRLTLYSLFYDRRKGEYRRLRKPIAAIVSIRTLAQAVMAILLNRPDDARARPQSLLKQDQTYGAMFSEKYNRDLYASCILLDRQVDWFLDSSLESSKVTRDERRNIRYYMDRIIGCELTKKSNPDAEDLAKIVEQCKEEIPAQILESACQAALVIYKAAGNNDTAAKGPLMRDDVTAFIEKKFPTENI